MSMLKAKLKEERVFKLICYKEGTVAFDFKLDKKKLLIGSAENSDIFIDDPHISHYHAFLVIDENGGKITDLESENGVYLNGQRVERSFFAPGDSLKIGPLEFFVEESFEEVINEKSTFIDQDNGKVQKVDSDLIQELPPELPPVPGLVVIDGEYCDIVFQEDNFAPLTEIPALDHDKSYTDFVDVDDQKEAIQIARENDNNAIEVTVLSQGHVISIDYFPLKNKTYYASSLGEKSNSFSLPSLENERVPFIKVSNGDVEVLPLDGFSAHNIEGKKREELSEQESYSLRNDSKLIFNQKTLQVIVRLSDAPPYLRFAPFFGRDRAFQLQATKIFSGLMSLFLLLLLIDTTVEVPKKKLAIIYRKAIKAKTPSKTKSKSIADKTDKDTGVKKNKQPKNEVQLAKKSPTKAKKKKAKKKPQKVAKATPTPKKKVTPKKPKIKAYEFKAKNSLSSLFNSSKSLKPTKVNSKTSSTSTSAKSISASSDSALSDNQDGAVGTLGQDFSGKYNNSTGAQGLSSKSGVDTTYIDPKTVVLGSMDPELLRKILKEYLPQFRHCYQKELERNESAKGVLDLNFRINPNGSVSKVRIKGKFSKKGSGCMAGVLKLIDFPSPKGGGVVDVRQPLNFFSEQGKY